jgi:hypothetical protein
MCRPWWNNDVFTNFHFFEYSNPFAAVSVIINLRTVFHLQGSAVEEKWRHCRRISILGVTLSSKNGNRTNGLSDETHFWAIKAQPVYISGGPWIQYSHDEHGHFVMWLHNTGWFHWIYGANWPIPTTRSESLYPLGNSKRKFSGYFTNTLRGLV